MPKTDTANRDLPGEMPDGGHRNARIFRRAGAGADEQVLRLHGGDFVQRDFIVAAHGDFLSELRQILHDVVGKAVVVVNE